MWCVDHACAVSAMIEVRMRSPLLMRWWCTAPTASIGGMNVSSPGAGVTEGGGR